MDPITENTIIGIQLIDNTKIIGTYVKSNKDFIWVKTKENRKPLDIPRSIIKSMLVLLKGGLDDRTE